MSRAHFTRRLAHIYELGGEATTRNLPMEGLRGFAVLLVFFVHYTGLFSPWISTGSRSFVVADFLGNIGHSGVDLFFVLSGYLIYGSVIKKRRRYVEFILRRVERIYPTFLTVLGVYLVLSFAFPAENKIPYGRGAALWYIAENLLLLPGLFNIEPIITVTWSLSYEFFYYLFIPLLVVLLGMRNWRPSHRVALFITISLAGVVCGLLGQFPQVRLLMFGSGILLFEAKHSFGAGKAFTARLDYALALLLAVTFPAIYALTLHPELIPWVPDVRSGHWTYRVMVLFVAFFALTLAAFSERSRWSRIFAWTPLRWLGNMSYSYYLLHGLTLKAVALVALRLIRANGNEYAAFWFGMPASFLLTLMAATGLFVLIERRFSLQTPGPRIAGSGGSVDTSVYIGSPVPSVNSGL